jgi:hypothetical protein
MERQKYFQIKERKGKKWRIKSKEKRQNMCRKEWRGGNVTLSSPAKGFSILPPLPFVCSYFERLVKNR